MFVVPCDDEEDYTDAEYSRFDEDAGVVGFILHLAFTLLVLGSVL